MLDRAEVDIGAPAALIVDEDDITNPSVTKPVVVAAEFTGAGANPMSQVQTLGFEGRTTIKRSDFGVDAFIPLVSDEVELDITAAFEKQ